VKAAIHTLEKVIFPMIPNDNRENWGEYSSWAISQTDEDHPFYFLKVIEGDDGKIIGKPLFTEEGKTLNLTHTKELDQMVVFGS